VTKVWIAQLKCPSNHCVLACYGEFESQEEAAALAYRLGKQFADACKVGLLKHECALCKSTGLRVQLSTTIYRTMAEAKEPMAELEREQAASRAFLTRSQN
jgi:hypothetical protein